MKLTTSELRKMGVSFEDVRQLRKCWGPSVEFTELSCRSHPEAVDWAGLASVLFSGVRLGEFLSARALSTERMGNALATHRQQYWDKMQAAIWEASEISQDLKDKFLQSAIASREKALQTEAAVPGPRGRRGGKGQLKNEMQTASKMLEEGVGNTESKLKSALDQLVREFHECVREEQYRHQLSLAAVFGRLAEELP